MSFEIKLKNTPEYLDTTCGFLLETDLVILGVIDCRLAKTRHLKLSNATVTK